MKRTTYYFSHDYNAANDVKILFLRQKLGMQGYGIYWFIIESLAQSNGILPYEIIEVLAMQMQVDYKIVHSVIYDFGLFVSRGTGDNKYFVSQRLLHHLDLRNTLKEKGKQGAAKRWGNAPPNGNPNANETKLNENKGVDRIVIR